MALTKLPDTLEITPKRLTLVKSTQNVVTITFKNSTGSDVHFTPFLNNSVRMLLECYRIKEGSTKELSFMIEEEEYSSPLQIGLISMNNQCFLLILPIRYTEPWDNAPECGICTQPYNETIGIPKSLPCGHTICEGCVEKCNTGARGDRIACPICRRVATVPGGVQNLPRNFEVLAILRNRDEMTPDEAPTSSPLTFEFPRFQCSESILHEATHFCIHCEAEYCEECFQSAHSPRAFSNHYKIPIQFPKCQKHPERLAEAICTDAKWSCDRRPMCFVCLLEDHPKHEYESFWANSEKNMKVLRDLHGVLGQKAREISKILNARKGEGEVGRMKRHLQEIRRIKNRLQNLFKSKGFTWKELSDMISIDRITELCFKEYIQVPPIAFENSGGTDENCSTSIASNSDLGSSKEVYQMDEGQEESSDGEVEPLIDSNVVATVGRIDEFSAVQESYVPQTESEQVDTLGTLEASSEDQRNQETGPEERTEILQQAPNFNGETETVETESGDDEGTKTHLESCETSFDNQSNQTSFKNAASLPENSASSISQISLKFGSNDPPLALLPETFPELNRSVINDSERDEDVIQHIMESLINLLDPTSFDNAYSDTEPVQVVSTESPEIALVNQKESLAVNEDNTFEDVPSIVARLNSIQLEPATRKSVKTPPVSKISQSSNKSKETNANRGGIPKKLRECLSPELTGSESDKDVIFDIVVDILGQLDSQATPTDDVVSQSGPLRNDAVFSVLDHSENNKLDQQINGIRSVFSSNIEETATKTTSSENSHAQDNDKTAQSSSIDIQQVGETVSISSDIPVISDRTENIPFQQVNPQASSAVDETEEENFSYEFIRAKFRQNVQQNAENPKTMKSRQAAPEVKVDLVKNESVLNGSKPEDPIMKKDDEAFSCPSDSKDTADCTSPIEGSTEERTKDNEKVNEETDLKN